MPPEGIKNKSFSPREHRGLWQRFAIEEEPTLLQGYRRASWLTIIFVLGGSSMDAFAYPEHWANFLILRIAASLALGLLYFAFAWPPLRSSARILAHAQALVPILIIEWMILVIGDGESPYYAGLSLVLVGSVLMHRWKASDGLINAAFVLGSYLAIAAAIPTPFDALARNTFFLLITAAISCIGLYYYKRLLFDDFCLRAELKTTNKELATAMKELRENEARLLHVEKLSSLGRMSAGIVHEINNPLNYAKTALHTLKVFTDDLPEGEREEYLDMLGDANEGVGRVIRIVTDLRSFTKGHSMDFAPVSLAKVIESTRRLVSQEIRNIAFEVEVAETLEVSGNDNQLVQVFVNLLQNASQAIHKASGHSNPSKIRISAEVEADGAVVVRVHDNGCGIPADELENIFDPFFTKRDIGEGMGLGLSICHRIIESHHATITAQSEDGQFTEFVLSFPSPGSSAPQIIPDPSPAISEI